MTGAELRALYTEAYKIAVRERAMRNRVFRPGDARRDEKLAEMDRLLEVLTIFKDALKAHTEPQYEQPRLLDAPKRAQYG